MTDCWRVYDQLTPGAINSEVQKEFYAKLAIEIIDSNYDTVRSATKQKLKSNSTKGSDNNMPNVNLVTGQPRCGMSAHLTPTIQRLCDKGCNVLSYSLQGRCRICQMKTTFQRLCCCKKWEILFTNTPGISTQKNRRVGNI